MHFHPHPRRKQLCIIPLMFLLIKVTDLITGPTCILSCLLWVKIISYFINHTFKIILMTLENVSPGRGTEEKSVEAELLVCVKQVLFSLQKV